MPSSQSLPPSGREEKPMTSDDVAAWRTNIRTSTFANYHYEMGVALQRTGETAAAVGAFERAIATRPDLAEAHYRLCVALDTLGDLPRKDAAHRAALAGDPDYAARAMARIAMESRDDPDAALTLARQATAMAAHMAEARFSLGVLTLVQGAASAGLEMLTAAVEADPSLKLRAADETGWLSLKALDEQRHQDAFAIGAFSSACDPSSGRTFYVTGSAAVPLWKLEEARQRLDQAVRLDPWNLDGWVRLGSVLELDGRVNEAETAYTTALDRIGDGPAIKRLVPLCGMGRIRIVQGRVGDALAFLEQASGISPSNPYTAAHLSLGRLASGDHAGAMAALAASTMADPWPRSSLGLVHLVMGRTAQAISCLERSAAQLPAQQPWILVKLALAYHAAGRPAEAVAVYRRAAILAPRSLPLLEAQHPWAATAFSAIRTAAGAP